MHSGIMQEEAGRCNVNTKHINIQTPLSLRWHLPAYCKLNHMLYHNPVHAHANSRICKGSMLLRDGCPAGRLQILPLLTWRLPAWQTWSSRKRWVLPTVQNMATCMEILSSNTGRLQPDAVKEGADD